MYYYYWAASQYYVRTAYCYTDRVAWSVCRSVTVVSSAKMAQPIKILLGLRTRVGAGNHVLDGRLHPPWEEAILRGKGAAHCKVGTGRDAVWVVGLDWPKKSRIRWGTDPHGKGTFFWGKGMPRHAQRHSGVNCAKTAEPIEVPFGFWTRVGRRKHKFSRVRQVVPTYPHVRARWRHLANTIEPSVYCGDAAFC